MVIQFIEKYKDEFKKVVDDLKDIKRFHKQIPNILTFLRLFGAIPAGMLFSVNPGLSIGMIAFLWFTDAIDGRLAKKFNAQSKLGADMDAFADKIMFLASSLPLMNFAPWLIFNFILEGVISLVNVIGRIKGLDTKTVFSGKVKTVSLAFTLVSGYLVQFFGLSFNALDLLMKLTALLQFVSIKDYICEFKRMNTELKNKNIAVDIIQDDNISLEKQEIDSDVLKLTDIKTSILELKHERDFYLNASVEDISKTYSRSKKMDSLKKK